MMKIYNPKSPFIFWAFTPFLILFAYIMAATVEVWKFEVIIFIGLCELFAIILFLKLLNPSRFWIAGRLLGLFIFCIYIWYLVSIFIASENKFTVSSSRSEPSVLNAILGLIFIGLPGIYFALTGRITYWKGLRQIGRKDNYDVIEDRNPELCKCFVKKMKDFLYTHQDIHHNWSIDEDEDHCILQIFKNDEMGFDVMVEVDSFGIYISASGVHTHLEFYEEIDESVNTAISLVKDLLSSSMRIIEYYSNDRPYRWDIEVLEKNNWVTWERSGLFFWNRFGKKSKKILINKSISL